MVSVILSLLLLCTPVVSNAATYYVATTGSNSNDGLTEDTPKLTIAHTVALMVAGDTTYVRGGVYNTTGRIRFNQSGTAAAPIRLLAYPGESPIINFSVVPATSQEQVLIQHASGINRAMGWITISGFEIRGGWDGIKFYSMHNSTITNNWVHDNVNQGILGQGGHHNVFDRNIISHNGPWTTNPSSFFAQGMYLSGDSYTISNNVIYDTTGYGLQQNGSSSAFNSSNHPSAEFAGAANWIVVNNTFAYNYNRAGITIWGGLCDNSRYENNIFYENARTLATGDAQGIRCTSCSGSTGVLIKNNHFYASGSGGQVGIDIGFAGDLVSTGNVINVSPPAFVNGGSNSLPASPDFRLTARSPVNIALANEFPTNGVVGAFQPPATPTVASITTNKITVTLPLSAAVPVQNLGTPGVSFSCTSNVCPGSPAVSSVSRVAGTDSQTEITLSGITSDACLSHADAVTVSYNASTGSWTGNDNIGPYPGLHQKILSFTSVAVVNNCTGSGPPGASAAHITYAFEDGTGTTVSDTSGNAIHATTSGSWVSGKTGFGIKVTGGTTQQTTIPYGSGINPTTQSMTWVVPVFVATGTTSSSNFVFGTEAGTDQRGYIAGTSGTWKVGRQNINTTAAGASNLAVTEGWNHLCVRWDSTTDTVTLYKDGVAGTGGATGSYTSYTLATNFEAPILGTNFPSTVTETIYDDVQVFTSLQDCAALYAAWNAPPPAPGGTLTQTAIQFQGVILDQAGSPIVVGPSVQSIDVPKRGGAVLLFQVNCGSGTDCDQTSFKLTYTKNGSTAKQQVPNTETADGTWMWGLSTDAHLNNGIRSTRLTGSCTIEPGATQLTSDQVPSLAIPQDHCTVLAYVVHVDGVAGDYFDYKLRTEADLDLDGGYTQTARVRVVNPMASGIGF